MSHGERHQPRHLTSRRWVGPVAAVVGVPGAAGHGRGRARRDAHPPAPGTRSASVSKPAGARATAGTQQGVPRSVGRRRPHDQPRRRGSGPTAGHKKLMDDYKSGEIDRAKALPQDSWWRQTLARTLKDGVAAADRYDADKATYRKLAAQCSTGGSAQDPGRRRYAPRRLVPHRARTGRAGSQGSRRWTLSSGSRWAATARRRSRNRRGRTMMNHEPARASTAASTCAFPTILQRLPTLELHQRNSSRDLIRKRSEVQVLAGPLHFRRSAGLYLYSGRVCPCG
jgi:hypothetical protein